MRDEPSESIEPLTLSSGVADRSMMTRVVLLCVVCSTPIDSLSFRRLAMPTSVPPLSFSVMES